MNVPPQPSADPLEGATWVELSVEYDRVLDELVAAYDIDDLSAAEHLDTLATQLSQQLDALQPWTVFDVCVGGSAIWVQAGPTVAAAAFDVFCEGRAFTRCGTCGDSNWTDCSESCDLADGPPADTKVISATEVAALLDSN